MKIEGINIKGFKGIEDFNHRFNNTVTVIDGLVGTGKTSLIQALRFGLTGELPTSPIRNGFATASVMLDCGEELCIEREISRPSKKSVKIVGRKVGVGASEEYISEISSVGNEIMKIATSSEVLTKLKPSEFGNIFLNESEEKKSFTELINIFKNIDSKEKKAVMAEEEKEEKDLPADVITEIRHLFSGKIITLEDINKAYEEARATKREYTALHKAAVSRSKDFLEITKPEYSESALRKKLEEIIGVEKNIKAYEDSVRDYNKAMENKKEQEKRIARIELEIDLNKATLPNTEKYKKNQNDIEILNKKIIEQEKILQTLNDNIKRLQQTILQLDKPVCPISKKLICKTDKTDFRDELEEAIFENQESVNTIKQTITEFNELREALINDVDVYLKNKEKYNKKIILKKELDEIKAHPIVLPIKPEKFEIKKDYSEEKTALQEKLDLLRRYYDCEAEYKESKRLKRFCTIYDFLVKALEPKGPVIKEFLESFAEFLEISCNERANLLKTGFETKFIPEDGLKVLFKPKTGTEFLPFSNLSNGERIFAELVLTDLINSFCNSRILILDDTDHLDKKSFRMLLDFVTRDEIKVLYDMIIISCVSHDDMKEVIKEYAVDRIEM
ncbi:AAA family ATPase [Lacrimispora amygdalina]|uniref:AAA family ATPase n=1 Tax=Lacrimispora amygdalina TaxID=253257 RepID=UPI000BE2E56D|nr:AAA family ATPase [Lacrimispora amygdalina]